MAGPATPRIRLSPPDSISCRPTAPVEAPLENRTRIAKAAGIIMLGNIISRLLGLAREQVIAALFGAKLATDVWTVASTVPTMVYDLLISGAISAALIPVFSDYAEAKDREELSRIVSSVLSIFTAALAVVVGILLLGAPLLVDILGGGFKEQARELTTYLVRLILPSVLFTGTAGILTAALYARQSFTLPAFSVAVYNIGIILGGVLLAGRLEVTSLAVGVLIGAFLQVAIQIPGLRGVRLRPALNLSHPGVRVILRLYAPVALGLVVSNIGVIIDRNLASGTGEGSLAAMRFATTLVQFPLGLVATAASFAVLPTLSRQATAEAREAVSHKLSALSTQNSALAPQNPESSTQHSAYASTLRMGMKMILLLIVPAAVGLAVLREPVIQLLFQRGAFTQDATALTSLAFLGYSPGIAFAAVDQLLIFAFYARKDTRTPVLVGVMAIFVYLAVALSLVGSMGMMGLVLANAVQTISHAVVLMWLLNRVVKGALNREMIGFLARIVGAAVAMGFACELLLSVAAPHASSGPRVALLVAVSAALGAVVYIAGITILRVREARDLWSLLASRLPWRLRPV